MLIALRRLRLNLLVIIGLILSGWCLAQEKKDEAKPKVVVPKITVSKETTWATEPLRDDGTVNYLEAVNRLFSKDVTPENNACVLLYQAMGPSPEGKRQPDLFFRRMGIEPLPDEGKYFRPFRQWIRERPNAQADGKPEDDVVLDRETKSAERPWTKAEFPLIAAWLQDNEIPLRTVALATERTRPRSALMEDAGLVSASALSCHVFGS